MSTNCTNCSKSPCSQRNKLCPHHSCGSYSCYHPQRLVTFTRDLEWSLPSPTTETPGSTNIPMSWHQLPILRRFILKTITIIIYFKTHPVSGTLLYFPHALSHLVFKAILYDISTYSIKEVTKNLQELCKFVKVIQL